MPECVVIVGSSVAGVRCAQALRSAGYDGQLVLVGAEAQFPYDKPPLSKQLLTGAWSAEEIRLAEPAELEEAGIELRLGVAARGVDVTQRQVELGDGSRLGYDRLVIATGVRPRPLPWRADPAVVRTIRTQDDALSLRKRLLASEDPLVVIGGGFIGAEVAASATELGRRCTIVEALSAPFSRVLGPTAGSLIARLHAENGVEVIAGAAVVGIKHVGAASVVQLADGRSLAAGTVVAGIGCVPNTEWLESSGIMLDDGVVTDEFCRARGVQDVYAIGDVARWYDARDGVHRRSEHWTHAFQQAQLAAHNILNPQDLQANTKAPYFWSDQHGMKIQMVGHCAADDDMEVLRRQTPGGERDVVLYSRGGRLTACAVFGWPQLVPKLRRAWEADLPVHEVVDLIDAAAVSAPIPAVSEV